MTFREFTGKNVEEAIRAAMAEFSSDLSDLDIEILAQGSRGILGVGGEEARILAAPKSAVAAADTIRTEAAGDAESSAREPKFAEAPPAGTTEEAPAPVDEQFTDLPMETMSSADDQVDELARAERSDGARRARGGRGRGGRGRNGRDREHGIREPRADRPPREPRSDRPSREPSPFVSGKPLEELSDEERATLETAQAVLTEMLSLMGVQGTVEVASGGETSRLNVRGDDLGALIGRRGEKLASLQHIVNLIVGRREGQHHRIAIDVENYRGRREDQLRDVADRAAKRVLQTGKIIQLEAMPAVERRIVHMALLENPKVRTQSVGVEPNRRIVVLPASQVKE
ncbi:MAG TPA: RNA-binding cell elongation regulator Jag/EloR, partial [Candidatus Limnocylindria bacterium]|nr:RNA-binding cell elongation regulator Jag/EloR [Candidatus Limnocylindria bacterium]